MLLALAACADGLPDVAPGSPDGSAPPPSEGPPPDGTPKDGGDSETLDLGPPRPTGPKAGSPCTEEGTEVENTCGHCGSQFAICTKTNEGLRIGAYGPCRDEKAGENTCAPGQDISSSCGYCGTKRKVCRNDCSWIEATCKNQTLEASRCLPGAVEQRVADCTGDDVRSFTCTNSCSWGSATACGVRPTHLDVPPAGVVSTLVVLSRPAKGTRPPFLCGGTPSSTSVYYNYIELRNSGPEVHVDVWDDDSGEYILAAYANQPTSNVEQAECSKLNDTCFDDPPTPADSCLLRGPTSDNSVTIPASSSRWIFVGNATSSGAAFQMKLSVRRSP